MNWRWWWQSLNEPAKAAAVCWALAVLWIIVDAATGGPW